MGQRHVLAVVSLLAITSLFMSRLDFSIAIVAMVKQEDDSRGATTGQDGPEGDSLSCIARRNVSDNKNKTVVKEFIDAEFKWDAETRAALLGSYYYGNAATQILAGWLAVRYGFRRLVGTAMLISSALSFLTPMAAVAGYWQLMLTRFTLGFVQGFMYAPIHSAWAHWAPTHEYSSLVAYPLAGCSLGTVLIFPLGGVLASSLGWRSVFYFTGASTAIASIAWWANAHDTPRTHPNISHKEREYILASQASSGGRRRVRSTPWVAILGSGPCWGVFVSHVSTNWGAYQVQSFLPMYLNDILGLDLYSNGFYTALPFIIQTAVSPLGGLLVDLGIHGLGIRVVRMRRLVNALGMLLPALFLLLAGYSGCSVPLVLSCFVCGAGFGALAWLGCLTSFFDFAPRFAPVIFGISNTFGQSAGFLAPHTTGLLLRGGNSHRNWLWAFWVSAMVYIPGFLCFQFLSTDEVQPWAVDEEEEEDKDLKSKGTETSLISAAAAEEEDKTLLKSQNKIMVASAEKEKC